MPKLKPEIIIPTDEEDRLINEGIAADSDTFEITDEMFAKARPASEVHPKIVNWYKKHIVEKQKNLTQPPIDSFG